MPVDPFSFDLPPSHPGRAAAYVARPLLSRLAGLDDLRRVYADLPLGSDDAFPDRVLTALNIEASVRPGDLEHIPGEGPLIVAANHPRGALDGLALAVVLRQRRADVRLVANRLLAGVPELQSKCFFVDPFGGPAAAARSLSGLRSAHLWLRQGGAIVLFPAGEVAHERDGHGTLRDRRWSQTLARLAAGAGATVVPAFIEGGNSRLFYAAGRLHPALRTFLLPRELLRARGSRVAVRVGRPIAPSPCDTLTIRAQQAVSSLARSESTPAAEIARLPPAARLLQSGRFEVFHADAREIPTTLQEIGRLRAVTFAAAGEGSGTDIDLDAFDRHYVHLFVWDRDRQAVVGAYRIGRADHIVRTRGIDGLYTRTLFRYGTPLVDALAPALELGRSFVRLEYQRDYQPLLLLWRGIGQFVVRHPEYRWLFGPVSISARYAQASRAAMTAFLQRHHGDESMSALVTPLHPGEPASMGGSVPATATEADRLVATLEADGKGMPVLLRQYLKLGARALGISIDPVFGGVTDVLMVVDLTAVSPAILRRYVGDDGLAIYAAHHVPPRLSPAA
jgi:putative hemolysin